jgi:hypothetical protein
MMMSSTFIDTFFSFFDNKSTDFLIDFHGTTQLLVVHWLNNFTILSSAQTICVETLATINNSSPIEFLFICTSHILSAV